jgi:hypothetical protein
MRTALSGALLLAFGLGIWLLFQPSPARWAAALAALTVVASLLVSLHLWWPRYGSQLWLLPIVPVVFVFRVGCQRWALGAAWVLLGILVVNAGIVAAVRMTWETNSTRTLRRQLTERSQPGTEIEVSFRWFEIPVAECLKAWGVRSQTKGRSEIRDGNQELVDGGSV